MSEASMQEATPRDSDREYFWFALVLLAVLTSSVGRPVSVNRSPPTTASTVPTR